MRCLAVSMLLLLHVSPVLSELVPKPAATEVSGKINWIFDYERGQELSRKNGKPMFVVFRCER